LTVARALLAELDVAGWTVTGDALSCQRDLSAVVVAAGADYLWEVKENQPSLLDAITTLFALPPPGERFACVVRHTRHGNRQEVRRLLASPALTPYLDWPGVRQVCRVERTVTCRGQITSETAYAITSAAPRQAGPRQLLRWWRGHWEIENRLHWVRDVTFDEDRSQVRTGAGPQVLAALRNTAIGTLRRAGHANIAEATRFYAAHPNPCLALLGLLPPSRL
jgi:predicted transposase YbfD/YdcC